MSRILVDEERCKGCGLCTLVCPHNLVQISAHFNVKGYRPATSVDPEGNCIGCANCATMCPDVAITVCRTSRRRRLGREELPAREKEVVSVFGA